MPRANPVVGPTNGREKATKRKNRIKLFEKALNLDLLDISIVCSRNACGYRYYNCVNYEILHETKD